MEEEFFLRTSERVTFTDCRQKWQWAWVECLKPIATKPALRFGDLVHQALAAYYIPGIRRGPHPAETYVKLYKGQLEILPDFGMYGEDGEWENALELGVEMLNNYVDEYGRDARYKIIQPEQPFQIDLYDPATDEYVVTQVGTFDAVIYDRQEKEYGLFEHKTAKAIVTSHLTLDEQAGTYWAFAEDWMRENVPGFGNKKLSFVLYNFLRKGKRDEREQNAEGLYLNKNGSVSKVQPPPLFKRMKVYRSDEERRNTMLRIIDQAYEMKMCRDGDLPIYKRPTRDCYWKCEFVDMCEVEEMGSDWEALRDGMFEEWEPYEAHESKGGM